MTRWLLFVACLTVLGSAAAPAAGDAAGPAPAPALPETLALGVDQAVALALGRGVEMRVAAAQVSAANGQVTEAAAAALPQVNGSVGYTRLFASIFKGLEGDEFFGPILKNSPFAAVNTWNVDLTASQILFSRQVGAALAAARAYKQAARASAREVEAQVTLAVTRAYFEAAYAGQVLSIAQDGLDQARAHMEQVALYRREGTRAEYDLIRAQVDALNQEPPVVAARNGYETALLELRRLLNLPAKQPLRLDTPLAFADGLVPVVQLESLGEARRATLEAADANVEVRRHALQAEQGQRWPDLSVSGTVSHQAFPEDWRPERSLFRRNVQATLKLELPLFLGLRTFGAVQRATAELREAQAERERLGRAVEIEVEQARQEVQRTLALLAARRGTVQLATRAHQIANVRYANGLATQLEVSDARLALQSAEVNEVQATKDYRVALAQLEYALGRPVPVERRPLEQLSLVTHREDR
jgi:outer membrane protein TolC